jgi:hypothetical protein
MTQWTPRLAPRADTGPGLRAVYHTPVVAPGKRAHTGRGDGKPSGPFSDRIPRHVALIRVPPVRV